MTAEEKQKLVETLNLEVFGLHDKNDCIGQYAVSILNKFTQTNLFETKKETGCGRFEQLENFRDYVKLCESAENSIDVYFSLKNLENLYSEFKQEFIGLHNYFNDDIGKRDFQEPTSFWGKRDLISDVFEKLITNDIFDTYIRNLPDRDNFFNKLSEFYDIPVEKLLRDYKIDTSKEEIKNTRKRR